MFPWHHDLDLCTEYQNAVNRSLRARIRGLSIEWFPETTATLFIDWYEDKIPAKEAARRFAEMYRSGERPVSRAFQTV